MKFPWLTALFFMVAGSAHGALEKVATVDVPGLDPGAAVVNLRTHDVVIASRQLRHQSGRGQA